MMSRAPCTQRSTRAVDPAPARRRDKRGVSQPQSAALHIRQCHSLGNSGGYPAGNSADRDLAGVGAQPGVERLQGGIQ